MLAHCMMPAALEYPSGYSNGLRVYRPSREGRSLMSTSVDTRL